MKKLLVILGLAAALGWGVAAIIGSNIRRDAIAREWPMGLGTLESVPSRYPVQKTNAAAKELQRLANVAGIDFAKGARRPAGPDPIADYVKAQLQRTDRGIDPAPALPDVVPAIRAHLLSGRELVWDTDLTKGVDAPLPNLLAHMRLSRLLTASAFDRASLGDAGAWDDLRAAHELVRGLWKRPDLISSMIALAIDRNVIAAARKMPLPAPAWFEEMRTFDYRKAMLASMQADTYAFGVAMKQYADGTDEERHWLRRLAERTVMGPYVHISRADFLTHQRESAYLIAKTQTCAFDAQTFAQQRANAIPRWNVMAQMAMPNLAGMWQRVLRLQPELELTEHALGLRSGSQSQCADGQWIVTAESVKFSRDVPIPSPANSVIPLEFRR